METIKVNMSPNPLDVQTIHASQNDGEAREWGFALHNNGDAIDSSSITDQLVFKSYKGGTEQILPENGAVPVTAPFVGDIKYPDATRTDQEFLYRQSPTEEDGNAKITDIKGNTLVWNQLQKATASTSTINGITYTNNGNGSWTVSGTATATAQKSLTISADWITAISGHKYLTVGGLPNGGSSKWLMQLYKNNANTLVGTDSGNGLIYTADDTTINLSLYFTVYNGNTVSGKIYPQIFDLTQMFGAGSEPSSVAEFTKLFPLPYYSYNQGTLLSFNGNGIKTVGANILDLSSEFDRAGVRYTVDEDGWFTVANITYPNLNSNRFMLPLALTNGSALIEIDTSKTASTNFRMILYNDTIRVATTTTKLENNAFDRISFGWSTAGSTTFRVMVTTMSTIGTYEPYTSSTLSLPITTYFPNGMKSAGTVYDELTPDKAIKRLEQYTFTGNETIRGITNLGTYYRCYLALPISSKGLYATRWEKNVPNVYNYTDDNSHYYVQNSQFWYFTTASTAEAIMAELTGTKFYYDLATPTETPFTTASLVTENAEIPLSNEDGVLIGKCTEQLSENPGFIDAKIKLSDGDGECYSNKIQLHIERSPQ